MEFPLKCIIVIFLRLNVITAQAEYPKSDELTLRNQLLADVYFLKEGVDRLLVSSEILNKRFNNQIEVLRNLQSNIKNNNLDSQEDTNNCAAITGMFNATLKKQNVFESRLLIKLEEMQDDQMIRFEEILLKQKLNKICGSQAVSSSSTLSLLSTTLTEVGEKIDQLEIKVTKLPLLDEIINAQAKKFDQFAENQMKILQQINDKLNSSQEQFDKINREFTSLKELHKDFKKTATNPRPKLPMEVILGLTSANITGFK